MSATPEHPAAAPDALRAAIEGLAAEWERLADGNEVARGRNTKVAAYYRRHAHELRALLDDPAAAGRAT